MPDYIPHGYKELMGGTCGKPIPHGYVARYTGVDIASIQAHHIRCGQRGEAKRLSRTEGAIRNVIRYALARFGLTKLVGLW